MLSLSKHLRFAGLLALGACSPTTPLPPEGEKIACAVGAGSEMAKVCVLEIVDETERFVIRHPDGGFRRFGVDPRRGWQVADGAEELVVKRGPDTGHVEFVVSGDRYVIALTDLPGRLTDG